MNGILSSLNAGFDNLLQNPNQALSLATGIQGAVNGGQSGTPARTAQNNTRSATSAPASSSGSMWLWIGGAVAGVVALVFLLKK